MDQKSLSMGVIRFLLPRQELENWPDVDRAFLGDAEGRVEVAQISRVGNELVCERSSSSSTRLFIASPIPGLGRPILNTTNLCERDESYHLVVELARGRLAQIRNLTEHWKQSGVAISQSLLQELDRAHENLRHATCLASNPEKLDECGAAALRAALFVSERLMATFIRQKLADRRERTAHLPNMLSCPLKGLRPGAGWERSYLAAMTAAKISVEWALVESQQGEYDWTLADNQIDFAEENRVMAIGGPLLDFRPGGFPAWLGDWCEDYWSFQSFVSDFVETAIKRYAGRIRLWEIAAGPNMTFDNQLDEEFRLALTAKALEVAREADEQIELSLRVVQPWGEYQRFGRDRLSPRQFAEALIRSGAGLSSVNLEIAVGFHPNGSDYRDRFELGRLLESWATLGVPLTISLAFPSQSDSESLADSWIEITEPQWKTPWSEAAQAEWMADVLPLLMANRSVFGIEWIHFGDGVSHRFPHAGLTRADGSGKMILERLTRFRQSYWERSTSDG